jgi:hypothetical protein
LGLTAGKKLYFELVDRGYRTVELSPMVMGRYVMHLAHATQVVNDKQFHLDRHTTKKYGRLVQKVMASPAVRDVLNDTTLD